MAIEKEQVIGNKATPISYWRYAGLKSLGTINDPQEGPIQAAVILADGYASEDAREAAKTNGRIADHTVEFLITNWKERVQEARPATVEEKKLHNPTLEMTDEEWESYPFDIVTRDELVPHNDLDAFRAALGGPDEAKVAYRLFKSNKYSFEFFKEGKDV